jgi:hypothetical protein
MISKDDKDAIYRNVHWAVTDKYGAGSYPFKGMGCLAWMEMGLMVLKRHGIRALPTAGSARFHINNLPPPDSTHLAFVWGGDREGAMIHPEHNHRTALPEMHCFILTVDLDLVDFSTGFLPVFAKSIGMKWELPPPPDYYWHNTTKLPDWADYVPNVEATMAAVNFLNYQHSIYSASE